MGRFGCAVGKKDIMFPDSFDRVCSMLVRCSEQFSLGIQIFFSEETNAASVTRILEVQRCSGQYKNTGYMREAQAWVIERTNCQLCC